MATAEQFLSELQRIGPTVRRGFTRDGRPVAGFGIWLDSSTYIANGYVWVQQAPPYNYVVPVHHCGITLGAVAREVGVQGWFDSAWTPSGAEGFRRAGRWSSTPQRGDWAFFNYGSGIIRHVGAVLDASEFAAGWVTCFEFNVDASGQGRTIRRPTWMIVGYGRPLYDPEPPKNRPIALTVALTPQEDDVAALIAEIYADGDLTGAGPYADAVPVRHEVYTPGLGWSRVTNGDYTEANGFTRVRYTVGEWNRLSLEAVGRAVTMAQLIAEKLDEQPTQS